MAEAILDRRMKARTVVELAKAGKLEHNGQPLQAFDAVIGTVRNEASKERRRRSGHVAKELATQQPRDLVEALSRELLGEAVKAVAEWKRTPIKTRDMERGRQIARMVREAAAIPAASDPRPPKPGAKVAGKRDGAETTGGLAGAILADHAKTTNGSPDAATRDQTPNTRETHEDTSTTQHGAHLAALADV